jgi:hypothetical protein
MNRWLWVGLFGIAAVIIIAVRSLPRGDEDQAVVVDVNPASDVRPVQVVEDGFVTSAVCQECHQDEHASWHASYHRTMTQVINPETAPDVIRDATVEIRGNRFEFQQEGDKFFVTFNDPLSRGERRRRELLMMTGSHHMHVFWYETECRGTPGELEIVYLKKEQRWIPRLSSFLQPPGPEPPQIGTWNRTCSKCHATHARERFDSHYVDWDTQVVEFGIACEACHGQGADHVKRHRSKNQEDADQDKIVNPESVSKQVSADICGRCHSISMPDFDLLKQDEYFETGNPFEPGELLAECGFNRIIRASGEHKESALFEEWANTGDPNGSFWEDGMPRVTGREYNGLIESPCFQHGEMTCVSCHTLHPSKDQSLEAWRDDQLKPGMRGDQACLQCHAEYAERIAEHTHHDVSSSGSRCMNCHMPHTTFGLLKTIRSHQISSPSIKTSLTTDRPSACALCHLDQSFTWTADHLHEWYGQPKVTVDPNADAAITSTAVIHLLKGDAAQRAIQAAAFGWQPAREASGTDWMEPFLLFASSDPYDAVRIVATRSLKSLPNRRTPDIDPFAEWDDLKKIFNAAVNDIEQNVRLDPQREVLIDENGTFDFLRARKLMDQRNHRPIVIHE